MPHHTSQQHSSTQDQRRTPAQLHGRPLYTEQIRRQYQQAGYWTDETFQDFLAQAARRYGDAEAAAGPTLRGEWQRLSFVQLEQQTRARAAWYAAHGIGPGEAVIVQLPNVLDYLEAIFGLFILGAVPVFSLPAHREAELTQFAERSHAAAIVTAPASAGVDYPAIASAASTKAGVGTEVFVAGTPQWESPAEPAQHAEHNAPGVSSESVPWPSVDPTDLAFLQVSGGTTGIPKLIPRSHADYLYSVRASAQICELGPSNAMLIVLPASHNFTMSSPGILGALWAGTRVVFTQDPSPTAIFRLIEQERITITQAVPPLATMWLQMRPRIEADLSSLRTLQVGGAKFAAELARTVPEVLGCRLQQVFGMAEGLVNYTRPEDDAETVATTQGRPISPADEIAILNEQGEPVAPGEVGRLTTRGPYTIRAYFRDADPGAFSEGGWYASGDLVRQLPSGHLIVEGREKDHINRGGEKISAEEVENLLLAHEGVFDVALVALPDAYLGERSCAVVIPSNAAAVPDAATLREFLRAQGTATFKIPDQFEFREAFPLTGVGKISRKVLRRELAQELSEASK